MSVEERIVALHRSGKRGDAATLAREVLKNETVEEVVFEETAVRVVTRAFVGEHDVADRVDGEVVLEEHGEYALCSDERVAFAVSALHDNVFAAIDVAEAEADGRGGPRADESAADDGRATF